MGANKKIYGYYPAGAEHLPIKVDADGKVVLSNIPAHKTSHQDGGADEIDVTGLKGLEGFIAYSDTRSKMIEAERDMAAASGDIAYTGVGFKPTSLIAIAVFDGSYPFSIGFCDSGGNSYSIFCYATNIMASNIMIICIAKSALVKQYAIVKSYDADGFTLTWTKVGLPTGLFYFGFLCFR